MFKNTVSNRTILNQAKYKPCMVLVYTVSDLLTKTSNPSDVSYMNDRIGAYYDVHGAVSSSGHLCHYNDKGRIGYHLSFAETRTSLAS